jgi:starch synthase
MRVAFVTSELNPYSKTGGLADVSEALPVALAGLGVDVTVFSPLYRSAAATLARRDLAGSESLGTTLWIGDERHQLRYRTVVRGGVRLVFVVDDPFYERPSLYLDAQGLDYADNAARFAFLCRAALEYWLGRGSGPDIFHVNDWQTALLSVYLKTIYRLPELSAARSVITVHNLGYQGRYAPAQLYATGLDWSVVHPGALEFYGQLNLLKGGLVFADAITTVSPSYAEEIQLPAFGNGLDGVLRAARGKLTGILNGIDTQRWNPGSDPLIATPFDAATLSGRVQARCRMRLSGPRRRDAARRRQPLRTCRRVCRSSPTPSDRRTAGGATRRSRFRTARSRHACPARRRSPAAGRGDGRFRRGPGAPDRGWRRRLPDAERLRAVAGWNQMYSQRYGTVPIVHAARRIEGYGRRPHPRAPRRRHRVGLLLAEFDAPHLAEAMLRAWRLCSSEPAAWSSLQRACMGLDHSWAKSARAYVDLYARLMRGGA